MSAEQNYQSYCTKFNTVYKYLCQNSRPRAEVISEICSLRNYELDRMQPILLKAGFIALKEDTNLEKLKDKAFMDLALFNAEGNFRLEGRYIFPVKDMVGNVVALIGWKQDNYKTKYLTTPSKYFNKNIMFYGMEQIGEVGLNKRFFLCEGIFDTLALRSLGFNALAQMGISSSRNKQVLYSLFKRLIGVPDLDYEGRRVLKSDAWNLPTNGSYLMWKGIDAKDIDTLTLMVEGESIREVLMDVWKEKSRIITLEV